MELSWIGRSIREWTGRYGSRLVDIAARVAEVDVVESIETISPKLERYPLVNEEVLLDREIGVEEPRSKRGVTANGPDLVERGDRERAAASRQGVGVVVLQLVTGESGDVLMERTRTSINSARRTVRELVTAGRVTKVKGQTAGVCDYRADLDSVDYLVDNAVGIAEESSVVTERKLEQAIDDDLLPAKETVVSFDGCMAPG